MKTRSITILTDNHTITDSYFLGEPGLSILIEDGEASTLFDCGYSDVFIRNATKLGKDLTAVDHLVLSHSHLDHTWGLCDFMRLFTEARFLGRKPNRPVLVAHPEALTPTTLPGIGQIGSLIPKERLDPCFQVSLSREPVRLSEHCTFLGEIPRVMPFEPVPSIGFKDEGQREDHIPDDSAIVCTTGEGLVIITGCSHAGICNICEYAKEVCSDDRIIDIIGGLHLIDAPAAQLEGTVAYLKGLGLKALHACHCTGLQALAALAAAAPVIETGAGLRITYT